jgi:hypothetical protein
VNPTQHLETVVAPRHNLNHSNVAWSDVRPNLDLIYESAFETIGANIPVVH